MVAAVSLGLRSNWRQFALLVVVNAFVGAMVGLERSVVPLIATTEFQVASTTAVLSFIATFGFTKALTNLASGWLAHRQARRPVLLLGWLIALPIPLIIFSAKSWWWIVAANALLGVNQGLAWSMTVIMKIDLVGPRRRGLATGLNEFAGYLAVAVAGVLSAWAASRYGLRPGTAWLALLIVLVGLGLSWFVRDTGDHVRLEALERDGTAGSTVLGIGAILRRSLWSDRGLFSISQAGLINNLNDGLAWGVFPLLFTASGLGLREMSLLAAIYPATWGVGQLLTGPASDRWGRKWPIVIGMLLQGVSLVALTLAGGFAWWAICLAGLGLGTALVYPTLIAAIGDLVHPAERAATVGVYRLWRDLGYVVGALLAGSLTDVFGPLTAINIIGGLTAASGVVVAVRLKEPLGRSPAGSPI